MKTYEQEALRVVIRQLERARDNLALGVPPVGHEDDHPVTAVEVALLHADEAIDNPNRYYMKDLGKPADQ